MDNQVRFRIEHISPKEHIIHAHNLHKTAAVTFSIVDKAKINKIAKRRSCANLCIYGEMHNIG